MKNRSIPYSLSHWPGAGARTLIQDHCEPRARDAAKREILLVSDDGALGERLTRAATRTGRVVVQVDNSADALRVIEATQPAVVLLDLDLPSQGAWEVADSLLLEAGCPPLILLTARSGEFDLASAIRAGSLEDKGTDAQRLLNVVDRTLAGSGSAQAERNAIQRVMIRWLKPSSWPVPVTPAHRFWGINE